MRTLYLCAILCTALHAATAPNTHWNLRTGGADTNGGSFAYDTTHAKDVNGAADLTVDATLSNKVTSASHNFVAADVGKQIQVTAGTGWTLGWYWIISTASNAATLQAAPTVAGNANVATYSLYSAVDYSQQNNPQVIIDNATITATCSTNTIVLTGYTATAADVWNGVHLTATAGVTAGYYQITAFTAATWTLTGAANACTAGPNAGVIGNMGGSLQTIGSAFTGSVAQNEIDIQTGTYTYTANINLAGKDLAFIGFGTYPGDQGTKPLITTSTDSAIFMTSTSGSNHVWLWANLAFSSTASVRTAALWSGGGRWTIINCTFDGFATAAINGGASGAASLDGITVANTEVKNSTGYGIYANTGGPQTFINNYLHDNTTGAIVGSSVGIPGALLAGNIIANNGSGAAFPGFTTTTSASTTTIVGNTFAGNIGDAVLIGNGSGRMQVSVYSNIFYANGRYGIYVNWAPSAGAKFAAALNLNNAYGANVTAPRAGIYAGTNDVTLTADPFTNAAAGDYSLNTAAGGGALLRGTGYPGAFPGGLSTGHADIGAVQAAPSAPANTQYACPIR